MTALAPPQERAPWTDPVVVAFAGYPVLWPLGAAVVVWPLSGLLAALSLVTSDRRTRMPPLFVVWLAFLAWMLLSVITVDEPDRAAAFAYRATMYGSASALFLYVYNAEHLELPSRRVMRALTVLWGAAVVGGVVGAFAPTLSFTSLTERLLPQAALNIGLVKANVHLDVGAISFLGDRVVGRPAAPFTYTNAWGSNLALLFPAAFAARRMQASTRYRVLVGGLAVVSAYPIVASLNRGMWISLVVAVMVVALRYAAQGNTRSLVTIFTIGILAVGALAATDLDSIVSDRAERGHSDRGRLALYEDSLRLTAESPLVGFGTPQPRPGSEGIEQANIGTHGQVWLLLVSHGVPGALLYMGFMVALVVRMRRWRSELGVLCQTIVVMSLVQTFVYEQLPSQLHIVMVVGALALREVDAPARDLPRRALDSPTFMPSTSPVRASTT